MVRADLTDILVFSDLLGVGAVAVALGQVQGGLDLVFALLHFAVNLPYFVLNVVGEAAKAPKHGADETTPPGRIVVALTNEIDLFGVVVQNLVVVISA